MQGGVRLIGEGFDATYTPGVAHALEVAVRHDCYIRRINIKSPRSISLRGDFPLSIFHYPLSIALQGPQAHATGGGDGRQEGRERGYYNLHRNLNNPLLHNCPLSIVHYQLRSLVLVYLVVTIAATDGTRVDHEG